MTKIAINGFSLCYVFVSMLYWSVSVEASRPRASITARFNLVATIVEIKARSNQIVVSDNLDLERKIFIVPKNILSTLNVGDDVRIYFRQGDYMIISLKKMTPVKFSETHNKGYFYP